MFTLQQLLGSFSMSLSIAEGLVRRFVIKDHKHPDKSWNKAIGDERFDLIEVLDGMVRNGTKISANSPLFELLLADTDLETLEARLVAHPRVKPIGFQWPDKSEQKKPDFSFPGNTFPKRGA